MDIDRDRCALDHNRPVVATLDDDPATLCGPCTVTRSYHVQRHLGRGYTGPVTWVDDTGETQTAHIVHFTNAGFRGIEFSHKTDRWHTVNAGRILTQP